MENNITSNEQILVLLEQQSENFPILKSFVISKNIKPSNLFLPQTLKGLAEDLSTDNNVIFDALNYLDVVKFYSTVLYSDPEIFINRIILLIVENRTVNNIAGSINRSSIDDFIFNSKEEANAFLADNKILLAIYLFSLVNLIFYKQS